MEFGAINISLLAERESLLHFLKLTIQKRIRFTSLFAQGVELNSVVCQVPVNFIAM